MAHSTILRLISVIFFHQSLTVALSDPRFDQKRADQISSSNLEFSLELVRNILNDKKLQKGVVVVSPVSLVAALHIAYMGAYSKSMQDFELLLKYNNHDILTQYPYMLHEEFGLILEDLQKNHRNPSRRRSIALWRKNAFKGYETYMMENQTQKPEYNHHNISISTAVFYDQTLNIRNEFLNAILDVFKAQRGIIDFKNYPKESLELINWWIRKVTNGKIPKMFEEGSVPEDTKLAIVSTILFKADWQLEFKKENTFKTKFFPFGMKNDTDAADVSIMVSQGHFPYFYDKSINCTFLGLPYKQNGTTMYIIFPDRSSIEKIENLLPQLTAAKVNEAFDKMEVKDSIIKVFLPKLNMTFDRDFVNDFRDLGHTELFADKRCNLAVMAKSESLKVAYSLKKKLSPAQVLDQIRSQSNLARPELTISKVFQKISLEINEKGTEGAAASAVIVAPGLGRPLTVAINSPFMFFIRHDPTKAVLFQGVVYNPAKN